MGAQVVGRWPTSMPGKRKHTSDNYVYPYVPMFTNDLEIDKFDRNIEVTVSRSLNRFKICINLIIFSMFTYISRVIFM